jgi:hypothetical protein
MNFSIIESLMWKYPTAVQSSHLEDGSLVFDSWECSEHLEVPTGAELEAWDAEYKSSTEYLLKVFDPEIAIGREAQVFDGASLIRLMPCSYTINELIRFKNFWGGVSNGIAYAGLQQIGQALIAGGQILQDDYDKLAAILLEQGIVLG